MSDPKPRLRSVGRYDTVDDCNRYEAMIELTPGVSIPVEWGSPELVANGIESEGDEAAFVDQVIATVLSLRRRFGTDVLEDLLSDARLRVRRVLADWQAEGLPARLEDVILAPLYHWQDATIPQLMARIEGLDRALRPAVRAIHLGSGRLIEPALVEEQIRQTSRVERRTELGRQGADGSIVCDAPDRQMIDAHEQHCSVVARSTGLTPRRRTFDPFPTGSGMGRTCRASHDSRWSSTPAIWSAAMRESRA